VKLTEIIYSISGVTRDAWNFIRHPTQIISQQIRRTAQDKLEEVEIPIGQADSSDRYAIASPGKRAAERQGLEPTKQTTAGTTNQAIALQEASALPSIKQKIAGQRGRYQLEEVLQGNNSARLYRGFRLANNTSVLIREYLLSEYSAHEVRQIKEKLDRLESISLKSGGTQDFRFLVPWDTAIDLEQKRGYLILRQPPPGSISLRQYLMTTDFLPPYKVRAMLSQILQSLWFLHTHTIRFTDGSVQRGLLHGNITLDSLLIVPSSPPVAGNDVQYQIHLQDFALWETPFQKPSTLKPKATTQTPKLQQSDTSPESFQQDLIQLGAVGFYLLVKETSDRYPTPPFDPAEHPKWAAIHDEPLKQFIRQLLGLDSFSFRTAEAASRALRALPEPAISSITTNPVEAVSTQKVEHPKWLKLLSGIALIGLLSWLMLWLVRRSNQGEISLVTQQLQAITDVNEVLPVSIYTSQTFNYTATDAWRDILGTGRVAINQNFQEVLQERDPRLRQYVYLPQNKPKTTTDLLKQVQKGEVSFALSNWVDKLPENLGQVVVAYDALVFFVASSRLQNKENISRQLNGEISVKQLRKFYTEDNPSFKPYVPDDPITTRIFRKKVLNNEAALLRSFNSLEIEESQPINRIFEALLRNADNEIKENPSIGFGRLSKVYGQCSVYPLAIKTNTHSVQLFEQDNGQPINPNLDLCNTKGAYWANVRLLENETYPFVYPMTVIYSKSNKVAEQAALAFIKVLETDEGQCLLSEAGLVPLTPVQQKDSCSGVQQTGVIKQWITGLPILK